MAIEKNWVMNRIKTLKIREKLRIVENWNSIGKELKKTNCCIGSLGVKVNSGTNYF